MKDSSFYETLAIYQITRRQITQNRDLDTAVVTSDFTNVVNWLPQFLDNMTASLIILPHFLLAPSIHI